jgi:hypothetical protein
MCRAEICAFVVEASDNCVIEWNFKSEKALRVLYRYVLENFDEISSRYERKENKLFHIDTGRMRWTIPCNPDIMIRSELANLLQGALQAHCALLT